MARFDRTLQTRPTGGPITGSRGPDIGDPIPWGPDDGWFLGGDWEDYITRGGYLTGTTANFPVELSREKSETAQVILTFLYARSWADPKAGYLFALPGASAMALAGLGQTVPETLTHRETSHMIPAGEWQKNSRVRMIWDEYIDRDELPDGPGYEAGIWRHSMDWYLEEFNIGAIKAQLPSLAVALADALAGLIPGNQSQDILADLQTKVMKKMGYWRPGSLIRRRAEYTEEIDRGYAGPPSGNGGNGKGGGFLPLLAAAAAAKVFLL